MDQQRLRQLEYQCIQDDAPECTATCPAHVDVRGMLAEMSQGNFVAGLKILRKALPFPDIISRICDQPCQARCKRGEAGGAIEIAALERACVDFGGATDKITILPRKPKKAAVVGGGLSGLTVAYELARRGYSVTLYEKEGHLGGTLWDYPRDILPQSVIQNVSQILDKLGVEVLLNTPLSKAGSNGDIHPLTSLRATYDAVYLGIGENSDEVYDLVVDRQGCVQVDALTYMTSQDGVFAGGGMLSEQFRSTQGVRTRFSQDQPVDWRSPILSVSDGKRAATSIDRYLQKVSLTASRSNEGPYKTRLYTSLKDIEPVPPVPPGGAGGVYQAEEAIREAQRCIHCECMECVKVCEYLVQYGRYPKKYVREIYNNLSIVMGDRHANRFTNSCSLCGLCGEVCPENLNMGMVCRDARRLMVKQERMPKSAHEFALRDMAFSNSENFTLARNYPGTHASQYVFFPGCQLSASYPTYVQKVYTYLVETLQPQIDLLNPGEGIGLMLRCCGAPAEWSGHQDLFDTALAEFRAEYKKLGQPALILACSSCYQMFKTYLPEVRIHSLWDIMAEYGLPARESMAAKETVSPVLAIHDTCSTRYETSIQDSVRKILAQVGAPTQELPLNREKTECCSYGGVMWLANRDLARKAVQRRISESQADYITYCAMCRDFFAGQGKPTLHLLDLIFADEPTSRAARKGPGYSQRHENRSHLKQKMLKEIWMEQIKDLSGGETIQLVISPEVQEIIDERLLLVEDLKKVIAQAERTGRRLKNAKTDHYVTYYRPENITYWVEYLPHEDGYKVYNAYSHRMEIQEESAQ